VKNILHQIGFTFCLILLVTRTAESFELELAKKIEALESLRPTMESLLGEELTNNILGASNKEEVALPAIPKLNHDAKSTDVYDRNEDESQFKISQEDKSKYNLVYLREVFVSTRGVEANADDLAKWMNVMDQGATREGIYRALVLDNTYMGLENYDYPSTQAVVDFALFVLEKFVGQTIKREALSGFNLYTTKRVVSEKCLEVMDELSKKPEDMQKWYAVLSSDLAKKYPSVWKNKLRQDKDSFRHLNWAKSVPSQFIKSEMLIKVHKVFNFLYK